MNEGFEHHAVMLLEAVDALNIVPDGVYMDLTFGRGGHSSEILQRLGDNGRLLAFDKDPEAIAFAHEHFGSDPRFSITHDSFITLADVAAQHGLMGQVNGILFDLGVSSPQLDDAARGFSFQRDGALDMRMDTSRGISAAQWLADASLDEITRVLREYGEERHARRIARAIDMARSEEPIVTTGVLASVIANAQVKHDRHKHPATRSFQGIRIFINRELDDLQDCLQQMPEVLAVGGRMVVISFHSLEDRISKRFIRGLTTVEPVPHGLPLREDQRTPAPFRSIGRGIKASKHEVETNPRARSAVMRVAEKLH